ncbi:retrotransposon protein, putative, ty3-gypsy subclass [Tanacetum coccineum]
MESSTSSQPNQPYSPINPTNLDMNFEVLLFSQEYNYNQDYSLGHGSHHGSAHGSVSVHDDEDDSHVEEVSPVKPKKPSRQNNISGNSMKAKGFWEAVIRYFKKETGSSRANHESGTNDLDVYHKACEEYKMIYKGDFTLEHCYNILKDHPGWKYVEMPYFYQTQGRKKSKNSETTSGSASGGLNLNREADEDMEETQEFRLMGRDRAKAKKKAAGSSRGRSSSFVDLIADKFYNMKQKKWRKKDEQQQSYIELKNRELSIREAEAREIAQLKREKLEIQR